MKHIKILIFLLFVLMTNSYGQDFCPPVGISTNPANPVNTQMPSKKNYFDWRTANLNS